MKNKDLNGILIVNKEEGWTSFDVVAKLRGLLKNKTGHAGTLDPMATGVVLVLLGRACRLEKYLSLEDKTYLAKIKLGIKTDTGDITGNIIESMDVEYFKQLTKKEIEEKILSFKGKQQQIPPKYSALKHKGQALYTIARENNITEEEFEKIIESKKREIEVNSIEVLDISKENSEIDIRVNVSTGTYIRSLAEEIAKSFKTVGTLKALDRISVGIYTKANSITIDEIEKLLKEEEDFKKNIIKVEDIFKDFPKITVEDFRLRVFVCGTKITKKKEDGIYRLYTESNIFIGLGVVKNNLLKREYIECEDKYI